MKRTIAPRWLSCGSHGVRRDCCHWYRLAWCRRLGSAMGHEERFPSPRLSGRCRFESGPLLLMISAHRALGQALTPSERGRARRPTGKMVRTDQGRDGRRDAETRPPTPRAIARHCRTQCPRYRARFHSGAAARRSQGRAGRACPSSNRCARSIAPRRRSPRPGRGRG